MFDVSSVSDIASRRKDMINATSHSLAFVTLKNNLMVLSLRAMMMQFVVLMLIAAFCFCGFLYALWTYVKLVAYLKYLC